VISPARPADKVDPRRSGSAGEGWFVLRLWGCLLLVVVVGLVAPGPAAAHLKSGTLSTDFEARVGEFRPAAAGLVARVLDGDQRLQLRVSPRRVVVVLGLLGEPFLRFSPAGVEANLASPTASSARVVSSRDAVASRGVRWRRLSRGHVLAWHEGRLRPMQAVRGPASGPRVVATWSIPLIVDGHRARLVGTEWFAAGPSLWPWLVAGALLAASGGAGAQMLSLRRQRLVASLLLPVAVAALLTAWFGSLLAGRVTPLAVLFAIAFCAGTAFFLLVVVVAASGAAQLGVMALISAFTTTFALPELSVFGHGFVLSALPALAARLAVAIAVVGGIVSATVSVPAVITLFESRPPAEG
jgi:hypothetical protein